MKNGLGGVDGSALKKNSSVEGVNTQEYLFESSLTASPMANYGVLNGQGGQ